MSPSSFAWNPGRPPAPCAGRDALLLFVVTLAVYSLTSPGATAYDQYALFADTILKGALSLARRPPHLEMAELDGRAYFSNPPTPAVLLVPFVWIGGFEPLRTWLMSFRGGWELPLGLMQTTLSIVCGALAVAFARVALGRVPLSRKAANWGAILFGFGSIAWYHATIGSVWYVAHSVHGMFMWLLFMELLGKARPVLMGLWLAAAFWCRMETILVAPFVLIARPDRWLQPLADEMLPRLKLGWLIRYGLPIAGVLALNAGYNYVRFGTIENYAYRMLIEKPEVKGMFPYGLLSWRYWPGHIQVLFNSWPIVEPVFPWILPKVSGTAIWMTTPAFIYAFRAPLDRLTAACWVCILLFLSLLVQHCGTGMTQLGYRFALDFYAPLTILTLRGMDRPIRWWHVGLILASVFVNAWCVWVLNILRIARMF